jgi:hypothetical protein
VAASVQSIIAQLVGTVSAEPFFWEPLGKVGRWSFRAGPPTRGKQMRMRHQSSSAVPHMTMWPERRAL